MAIGIPYKQAKLAEQWNAIMIGSGIGGLTAAITDAADRGKIFSTNTLALLRLAESAPRLARRVA
jgi:hypothetical protein